MTTIQGAIPRLVPTFRRPERSTSRGALYPAMTSRTGGGLVLLLTDASQKLVTYPLGP